MAQQSRAGLKAYNQSRFPDNTSGSITPQKLRDVINDIIDSFTNITDDAPDSLLFVYSTDVGNVGTGEDDLYSDSLAAGQLSEDGDTLQIGYSVVFDTTTVVPTRQVKIYFGGTLVYASGALTVAVPTTGVSSLILRTTVTRVSATVVRVSTFTSQNGASTGLNNSRVIEVTGLTLSNAQVIKITGETAGVGAATNQIVAKSGYIAFKPI